MNLTIDRSINNIENKLSAIAAYPGVGTLAGAAKVALGAIQLLVALTCGILTVPYAICTVRYLQHSWTHIKHGLANMIAGIAESIPVVQTIVYLVRTNHQYRSDLQAYLYTGHEDKFMPYTSLVERDWGIGGADEDEVRRVKKIFEQKVEQSGGMCGSSLLSQRQKMKLALEALNIGRYAVEDIRSSTI